MKFNMICKNLTKKIKKTKTPKFWTFEAFRFLKPKKLGFFEAISNPGLNMTTAKVSEETNRNLPARNTLVQLLALYTNPESLNVQCYRQTDRQTDGETDDIIMPIADHAV